MKKLSGANKPRDPKSSSKFGDRPPPKAGPKLFLNRSDTEIERVSKADPCRILETCGACPILALPYREQILKKGAELKTIVAGYTPAPRISECVPSLNALAYRHVAKLVVADETKPDGSRWISVGLYQPNSHQVLDIGSCPVQTDHINQLVAAVRSGIRIQDISVYNPKTKQGLLRYLAIKQANASTDCLLTFIVQEDERNKIRVLARELLARFSFLKGVLLHVNASQGNEIFSSNGPNAEENLTHLLAGEEYLNDTLGNIKLRYRAESFTQVNPETAVRMYQRMIELLAPEYDETLLDLYSGIGSIALNFAGSVKQAIGIEENSRAVADAHANMRLNQIKNAQFYTGRTEDLLPTLNLPENIDLVTLNPSRRGADPEVLKKIAALAPRAIAYMSCDARTMFRDCKVLQEVGYDIRFLEPYDMFPGTNHFETLAILTPR